MVNIVEAVINTILPIAIQAGRSIGGIVPDVTVEEVGRDTTFITNHPVERGAAVTDHAFMMPVEVEMRVGWSDSSGGFEGYAVAVYEALQALQVARQPFEVVTGKRIYESMLIASMENTTNGASEYALMTRVVLREIIIVGTQTASSGIQSPLAANQAVPQTTTPPVSAGTQQLIPSPVSPSAFP